jgi:hypothetical protein
MRRGWSRIFISGGIKEILSGFASLIRTHYSTRVLTSKRDFGFLPFLIGTGLSHHNKNNPQLKSYSVQATTGTTVGTLRGIVLRTTYCSALSSFIAAFGAGTVLVLHSSHRNILVLW